jgi:hypothetical protein
MQQCHWYASMLRTVMTMMGLGAVLCAVIGGELAAVGSDNLVLTSSPPLQSPAPSSAAVEFIAPAVDRGAVVDRILARPLFSSDRRSPPAPTPVEQAPAALPRLTGVLVYKHSGSAIFAAAGGSKPLVAQVGGQVGNYTVESIKAGEVTLSGPGGTLVLKPRLANAPDTGSAVSMAAIPVPSNTTLGATPLLYGLRDFPGPASKTAR